MLSFTRSLSHFVLLLLFVVCASAMNAQQLDEPLFPVNDQGRTSYIDRTGKVVLTVPYPGNRFSEGLARVTVVYSTGYIERTGKLVIAPLPFDGRDFSNGLARVSNCPCRRARSDAGHLGLASQRSSRAFKPCFVASRALVSCLNCSWIAASLKN